MAAMALLALPVAAHRYYVTPTGAGRMDGSSWVDACRGLHAGLALAASGDSLWVAEGVYVGGFPMKEGVQVLGGFRGDEALLEERQLPATGEQLAILDGDGQFRVLTQAQDAAVETCWDGFVLRNGLAVQGAGALLRGNGVLRNSIVTDCHAGYPSAGTLLDGAGGFVLRTDTTAMQATVLATADLSTNYYTYARACDHLSSFASLGQDDWRMPTADEIGLLSASVDGKSYRSAYLLNINDSLQAHRQDCMQGASYWGGDADGEALACLDCRSGDCYVGNLGQYALVRPVRTSSLSPATGMGGGIYAAKGSGVSHCAVYGNGASQGCAIYARGASLSDIDVALAEVDSDSEILTGIEAVKAGPSGSLGDGGVYDLQGRKVAGARMPFGAGGASSLHKGIYIVNGKKVIR